jgi:hypothetical protein
MKPRHSMVLIEGSIMHRIRKYSYRGHVIIQEYRSHDVRNATHKGYWWSVQFKDGTCTDRLPTRERAKAKVDEVADWQT